MTDYRKHRYEIVMHCEKKKQCDQGFRKFWLWNVSENDYVVTTPS